MLITEVKRTSATAYYLIKQFYEQQFSNSSKHRSIAKAHDKLLVQVLFIFLSFFLLHRLFPATAAYPFRLIITDPGVYSRNRLHAI